VYQRVRIRESVYRSMQFYAFLYAFWKAGYISVLHKIRNHIAYELFLGKRKIRMAFGLYDDRAIHYEKVVKYLEKLDLSYVKLEYKKRAILTQSMLSVFKTTLLTIARHLWQRKPFFLLAG